MRVGATIFRSNSPVKVLPTTQSSPRTRILWKVPRCGCITDCVVENRHGCRLKFGLTTLCVFHKEAACSVVVAGIGLLFSSARRTRNVASQLAAGTVKAVGVRVPT